MDFDTVLEKCGNFGRYQVILLLLFGYTNILSSIHYFSQTLISFTPEHWCHHESLSNLTFDEINSVYAQTAHPSCTLLDKVLENGSSTISELGSCDKWIYKYESGYKSITTELNWVCNDGYKLAVGQSFLYIGSVIGTIFFGYLADKIGRLPALILTTLTGATGDFATSFTYSLPAFAASRFLSGLSTDTVFYLMYIMVFEYLDPKKRTFGLNIITASFYCFGLVVSPWIAVWIGSWRQYLLFASLPALLVLCYPILICESALWLITRKNLDGAVRCLKRVAKANNRVVEESVFVEFKEYYERKIADESKNQHKKDTFIAMFRTPRLRKFTIVLLLKSVMITLAFDVISRDMEGLGSSPFMLFSVSSFVYIPGGLTIILGQNTIGRKGMACASLLGGGIITAITGIMIAMLDREKNALLLALMVTLGRYGAIVAYDAEAQYGAEIIPTSVRAQGMANIHVVGYAFSFLSAYVIYLGTFYKPLPPIFISALMFIGAALCLTLPETQNKKLPETLYDGENFARKEKWHYFFCLDRKNKKTNDIPKDSANKF